MKSALQEMRKMKEQVLSWVTSRHYFQKTYEYEFKLLSDPNQPKKKKKHSDIIKIPPNKYHSFLTYMHQFLNSTSQNGRVNGQQLTFVTGMHGVGKTTFIKEAIREYRIKKSAVRTGNNLPKSVPFSTISTPESYENLEREQIVDNEYFLPIEFDFQSENMMTPEAFFHLFQHQIISKVVEISIEIQKKTNTILLDQYIIAEIVLSQNSPHYIFMCLSDTLFAIINDCDLIMLSASGKEKLQEINERFIDSSHYYIFDQGNQKGSSLYGEVIDLISEQVKISKLEAAIKLFQSVFMRVEYENRPNEEHQNGWYENGIESCGFVMDVLNYVCGFGGLNQRVVSEYFGEKQGEKKLIEKLKDYWITKGNHIDVVVTLLHVQKLSCFHDPIFSQWFDALLIRLHNQSNIRTHFPFLIEMGSNERIKHIQKLGRYLVDNPTVLEIPGYFVSNLHQSNLPFIFDKDTIFRLHPILGRNPSVWNEAIRQLASGVPIEDITSQKADFINCPKLINKFNNKINRLYIDPWNLPHLDDNTLKFHIRYVLRAIDKCNGFLSTQFKFNNIWLFENPTFSSFFDSEQGLLFTHYYYFAAQFTDQRSMIALKKFNSLRLPMMERMRYYRWLLVGKGRKYRHWRRELKEFQSMEMERFKRVNYATERADYLLQEQYYGLINEYNVARYELELKQKYNI